jgi:PAS domain S-box-containing protein
MIELAAVAISALVGGAGPALLTGALCAAGHAYLFLRAGEGAQRHDGWLLLGFVATALLIAAVGGALDRARRRRVAALEALHQAEQRFRAMIEGVQAHAIVLLDPQASIASWNPAAARMFGLAEAQVVGRGYGVLFAPEEREAGRPEDLVARARAAGRAEGEGWRVRGDGGRFFATQVLSALEDREGRPRGFVEVVQDATERRRAEEAERFVLEAGGVLSESLHYEQILERLARLAVPRLADACQIDTVEPDGPMRLVALAHSKREREASARELRLRFPPDAGRSPLARALRSGEPLLVPALDGEFLASIASGPDHLQRLRAAGLRSLLVVPLLARGSALGTLTLSTDASGRTLGPEDLVVARELARRAAHAIENARLYREAQRAIRQRDEVLAIVSHDLRTPLGAILMSARSIVSSDADVVRARRAAATIERAARGMTRLISDLLDLASLDAGRLSISRRPEDPASLVREAAELVRQTADDAGLDLHVEAPQGLPAVACDRDRVLQVLGNLLANAVKATEAGFVAVRVRTEGAAVVFEVEDSGPGIPEEDLPHLFDAFRRARGAAYHGTGLGLSIVRGLVEAQGGAVWVRSRLGEGSTFAFSIPLARPDASLEARTGEGVR